MAEEGHGGARVATSTLPLSIQGLADGASQHVSRKGLRDQRYSLSWKTRRETGVGRVAGNEHHRQPGQPLPEETRQLTGAQPWHHHVTDQQVDGSIVVGLQVERVLAVTGD